MESPWPHLPEHTQQDRVADGIWWAERGQPAPEEELSMRKGLSNAVGRWLSPHLFLILAKRRKTSDLLYDPNTRAYTQLKCLTAGSQTRRDWMVSAAVDGFICATARTHGLCIYKGHSVHKRVPHNTTPTCPFLPAMRICISLTVESSEFFHKSPDAHTQKPPGSYFVWEPKLCKVSNGTEKGSVKLGGGV